MADVEAMSETMAAAEPRVKKWVSLGIAIFGVCAAGLGLGAEITRTKTSTYLQDSMDEFRCHYQSSPAAPLASGAVVCLLSAVLLANQHAGWLMCTCRRHAQVGAVLLVLLTFAALFSWIFFLGASGLLIMGAVQNEFHTNETFSNERDLECSVTKKMIFSVAAVFALVATLFLELYYLIATRVKRESWELAGPESFIFSPEEDLSSRKGKGISFSMVSTTVL